MKKDYSHNVRAWEKRNGIYNICLMVRGEDFSKEDLELVKKDLSNKGMSLSIYLSKQLISYRDNMKGGN